MSFHEKLSKAEWMWVHSYGNYDKCKDSNFSKIRREYLKKSNDYNRNNYFIEYKVHHMVCWKTNNLLPSFVNHRTVMNELCLKN